MIIRLSNILDIPKIRQIMSAVFGDSALYLDLLFKYKYDDNVVVCEIEHEIVASAFLLPAQFNGKPCTYIYGCATLPLYRRKGIMKEILDFAFHYATSKNQCGVCLVPATEELLTYYESIGFSKQFYHNRYYFDLFNLNVQLENRYFIEKLTPSIFLKLRENFTQNIDAIEWDLAHFELVEKEYAREKGGYFSIVENSLIIGIGFYYTAQFKTYIPEFLGTLSVKRLANIFFNQTETNEIEIFIPGTDFCYGMSRWIPENFDLAEKVGYISFALD